MPLSFVSKCVSVGLSLIAWFSAIDRVAAQAPAASEPTVLPGVVVQGATLERPRVTAAQPAPTPGPAAGAQQPATPQAGGTPVADAGTAGGAAPAIGGNFVSDSGASVSVVTGDELRRQGAAHAGDALRSLPGVTVSRTGSVAGLTEVTIRGMSGRHTLVLIDGVPANSAADGFFDFSNLLAGDIERIEVIRGPMSGIYGSSAVGGVINIITRDGRGPLRVTASSELGSMRTRAGSLGVSGGSDAIWGAASMSYRRTGGFNIAPFADPFSGFTDTDGSSIKSYAMRGGVRVAPGLVLDGNVRYTDKRGERDGFGGSAGLATAVDDPSKFGQSTLIGGVSLTWDTPDKALTQVVRQAYNRSTQVDIDQSFGTFLSKHVATTETYGYQATYRFATPALLGLKNAITGLVERQSDQFQPLGDLTDQSQFSRRRISYAGEWRGNFADRLALTGNLRRDEYANSPDFTTWRLAAVLNVPEAGLKPHASIGTSVLFPNMFQLYGSIPAFFVPNPNLKPEQARSFDVGVEFAFAKAAAAIDVTYFNSVLTNEIFTSGFPYSVDNRAGQSTRQGIEVSSRFKLGRVATLGLGYTWLDARDDKGFRDVRKPTHSGKADITAAFLDGKGRATLGVAYNGLMKDNAFQLPFFNQVPVTLKDFWLASALVSYRIAPQVEVYGRVENAFNQKYQEVYGYNTAGIAAYAGVKVTFEEARAAAEK